MARPQPYVAQTFPLPALASPHPVTAKPSLFRRHVALPLPLNFFQCDIPSVRVLRNICVHFPYFLVLSSSLVWHQGLKLPSMLRNYCPHSLE
jgi:hypothetical protein